MIFSKDERDLLDSLKKGGKIPENKIALAHRLSSIGVIELGYDDEGDQFCETGHLTGMGREMLQDDHVENNFFLRILDAFLAPL